MASFKIGKILLSSVFRKPVTILYPTVPGKCTDVTRGHVDIDPTKCILCGICSKKCPADAITVKKEERSWEINRMSCVQCRACVDSCPKTCLFMKTDYTSPDVKKIMDCVTIEEIPKN